MKKKYYSPIKEYSKVKRYHPFYNFFRGVLKLSFPKNELVWKTEKPKDNEPVFFVCNHTKLYAPAYFLLNKKPFRVWSNCYFLFYKDCWQHLKKHVCKNHKYLYPLAFLLTPLIVLTFRALNPIPVYHKSSKVITETFAKSIYTMEEGMNQVIFPERTEFMVNKYVYQFNHGFPMVAQIYYEKTGKCMKFYPVYCAQKLRILAVGEPITYNPEIPIKTQRTQICEYLQDKIAELAEGLPEHEPSIYGF
jgi:hypothetical protein